MRILIAYNSRGGNTKQVAESLQRALAQAGAEVDIAEVTAGTVEEVCGRVGDADAVLAGFWCDKGTCTAEMDELLAHLGDKRVFLFGTAGFGGAPEYFDRILSGVRAKLPDSAAYAGGAMCQGRMGEGVRRRYEAMLEQNPGDARVQGMIANFDAALAHPDADDLDRIAAAAREALGL